MGFFKDYVMPVKAQQEAQARQEPVEQTQAASIEMKHCPSQFPAPSFGRPTSTIQSSSTPWQSRPASLSASGGLEGEEMGDVRCEMVIQWLHQQQVEKSWFENTAGEGVVLRKSKGVYLCCPDQLAEPPMEFRSAIEALNVKVSILIMASFVPVLTALVRHDRQNSCSEALLVKGRQVVCPITRWFTPSGPSKLLLPPRLPEASIRGLRS